MRRPRDGDGDGFVYDDTPRMRPWNPATDAPYPDGEVPEAVRRRQSVARQKVQPPGPKRPIERRMLPELRGARQGNPQPTREAIEAAFAYDDGEFYTEVRPSKGFDGSLSVNGDIYRRKGDGKEYVGYFTRGVNSKERVGYFDELYLEPQFQGRGFGSRLFTSQVDGLRRAGVERIDVGADSDLGAATNGAYTWARAGYDWKPRSMLHRLSVGERLREAIGDRRFKRRETARLALDMARQLDTVSVIPDDPADLPDDFPTPNDVAMLGWTPGATEWLGKDLMNGDLGPVRWEGTLDLRSDRLQLGVDDIGELPNPFVPVDGDDGQELGASTARPVGVTPEVDPGGWTDSFGGVGRRRVGNRNRWVDEQTNTHRIELADGTRVFVITDVETGRRGVREDQQLVGDKQLGLQSTGQLRAADAQWIVTLPDGTEVTGEVDGFLPGETAEEFTARAKALALADVPAPVEVPETPEAPEGFDLLSLLGVDTPAEAPAPDAPTEVTFYEVGGAVRDDLMGIFSDDVDFAVTAPSYEAMKAHLEAEGFRIFQEREEFATIKAKVPDGHPLQDRTAVADFVLARRDGPSSDGRRPDYTEPGTLEEDLARRDFTVNAIARDVDGNLIDPFGGQADIEAGVLRFVGDPMQRVREDGLRVLRGFRFMVTKDLRPDPATWAALTSDEAAEMLASVSNERVSNELQKMLDYDTPGAVELLGQLPAPVLNAIFRDGVRLAPNLRQPRGEVRDADRPRNPFIPVDGDVIELGSSAAGWERKPDPDRPVRRADLPWRYVNDWSLPTDTELAAAFDTRLPNGYRVRAQSSNGALKARLYAPDAVTEVGFFDWKVYDDSPTAYLSLAVVNPEHRGQGLGGQAFTAAVDALRGLGVDTIELLALSSDTNDGSGNNGGYTWARAGFDWEPGSWDLPDLAVKLATFARDRDGYSPEAQQEAFRVAALLTTRGKDLPYDPAEYPDDLPTPNDVAMIGWTPGATSWLGRDFLSGPDPIDGSAFGWSGAMRIDALDLPPDPFAPVDGDVELGSSETSYLDRIGDVTWDQLRDNSNEWFRDVYPTLSEDEQAAGFAQNRAEKREFTRNVVGAISTGEITPEDAIERFNLRDDLTGDFGHGYGWQPLPPKLYHVTTAATAVEADGRLRTRTELEMQRATGLGGGTSDAISFTADRDVAEAIAASMREASDVAAGRTTVQDMLDEAERDGFLADFVGYWRSGWKEGDDYPPILERMRRNLPWQLNRSQILMAADDPARWEESDSPEEDRLDVYKMFSAYRERATGRLDPLFFGTDAVALANMDVSEVAIVETEPVPGGMGVQMSALGEWRTPTGDAVTITDIVAPAAVVASAGRRMNRTRPRDGDGDGFVYDNTPRQRPWNPATDVPYPDGVIPETARRVVGRNAFTPTDRGGTTRSAPTRTPTRPARPEPPFDFSADTIESRMTARWDFGVSNIERLQQEGGVSYSGQFVEKVQPYSFDIETDRGERFSAVVRLIATAQWDADVNPGEWTAFDSWAIWNIYNDNGTIADNGAIDKQDTGDGAKLVELALDKIGDQLAMLARPEPAAEGVLAVPDSTVDDEDKALAWQARTLRSALADGPELSADDAAVVGRYRRKVSVYGDELARTGDAAAALAATQAAFIEPLDGNLYWRNAIEGRGYLSANLRALAGEPGFGPPDPDAIRFLQIVREDFLAKVPDTPTERIRLYRASNDADPFGGNLVTRFGRDPDRPPTSGVTSWGFMSLADAERSLSMYGDYLHGEDIPFDQVIGRFGAVDGELLVADDPTIIERIDSFKPGNAVERALGVLAALPDDPFAAPDLRLTATARTVLDDGIDNWMQQPAADIKRRFPDLSDEDAYKLALFGGVPEGADTPWAITSEWLADVPWPRVKGFAVDLLHAKRDQRIANDRVANGDTFLALLRRDAKALHPSGDPTLGELPYLPPGTRAGGTVFGLAHVTDLIDTPNEGDVERGLTPTDRERLDRVLTAGRILWADLQAERAAAVGPALSAPAYDPELADRMREGVARHTADRDAASTAARAVLEANLLDWLDLADNADLNFEPPESGPRSDTWPVGPVEWLPVESLLDVKGPRFTDSRGEGYRFRPIEAERTGDVVGFRLVKDRVEVDDPGRPSGSRGGLFGRPEPSRYMLEVNVPGAKPVTATTLAGDPDAVAALIEAVGQVEAAREADALQVLAQRRLDELELLSIYGADAERTAVTRRKDIGTAVDIGYAIESERSVLRRIARQAATAARQAGAEEMTVVALKAQRGGGDGERAELTAEALRILGDLTDARVMAGTPRPVKDVARGKYMGSGNRAQDSVDIPLDVPGWGAVKLTVDNPDHLGRGTPAFTLSLYREAPTGWTETPDFAVRFTGGDAGRYLPEALPRHRAAAQRWAVAENLAETASIEAARRWAAETLQASAPPPIRDDQPYPVDNETLLAKLAEHATPFIPDSLKTAAGPVQVGPNLNPRSSYTAHQEVDGVKVPVHRLNMHENAKDSVYLHEYGHHIERLGAVGRAAWAFYHHRTEGDEPIPLGDGYEPDEVTRPDEFFTRYSGRDYGSTTLRSKPGQSEVFTMGLEAVFFGRTGRADWDGREREIDDEYAAFVLGTLLHAGERATKYLSGYTPRSVTPSVPMSGESVPAGPPVATPGVELETPSAIGAPVIPPSLVADVAASRLRRRDVERAARGVAEATQSLREVIEHSQQSLREQGVETVTLYRGAREGVDPFDSRSSGMAALGRNTVRRPSGITSWTTDPTLAASYLGADGLTMYRAEVPVEQIVSYDLVGDFSSRSDWRAGADLDGSEVLVAADPAIVDRILGRVTPAMMEDNGTAPEVPAGPL